MTKTERAIEAIGPSLYIQDMTDVRWEPLHQKVIQTVRQARRDTPFPRHERIPFFLNRLQEWGAATATAIPILLIIVLHLSLTGPTPEPADLPRSIPNLRLLGISESILAELPEIHAFLTTPPHKVLPHLPGTPLLDRLAAYDS
jgi:hypothetical protein